MLPALVAYHPLLECVPNFSEGRDETIIDAIASAASGGAYVADVHSDADHHRSVVTLIGRGGVLVDAVVAAAEVAIKKIDMATHHGEHPRLGAVDVVPFIPIGGSHLRDAVRASIECAEKLCKLGLPCFLYELSSGLSLPEVRKHAFKTLGTYCGPNRPHPKSGAAAVGARRTLVAFNVNLGSTDVEVAREIARVIRESGGGLPHLRALGFRLESRGMVQVSCNLLEPSEVTMSEVLSAIEDQAAQRGVEVLEAELVGLAPEGAFGERGRQGLLLRTPPETLEEAVLAATSR